MAEDNAYTTDGYCLLDCGLCSHTPLGDCDTCPWWKDYILNTTGAEE